MRAVVITSHGGPRCSRSRSAPIRRPGRGRCSSTCAPRGMNFADTMARVGLYPERPSRPCVVGYEVAGTIAAVGEGVDRLAVGERVIAGTRFGGYASQVVGARRRRAARCPSALSFEQGAAIPVNYATAWAALLGYGCSARRARAHPRRRRRGGDRGDADRQARAAPRSWARPRPASTRRSASSASTTRSTTRERLGARPAAQFDVVLDAIGGRSLPHAPTSCCAPAGASSPSAPRRSCQGEKRNLRRAGAATALAMPRFNLIKPDVGVQGGDRPEHAARCGRTAARSSRGSARCASCSTTASCSPVVAEAFPFDARPTRTASSPSGATSARSCCVP